MNIEPSVTFYFNGNCEAAFDFYERHLGAKVGYKLTWADSPMAGDVPAEWQGKLLHARLMLGNLNLVGGDLKPGSYQAPQGVSILLSIDDQAGAQRCFDALAESGTILVPFQKTFWAPLYGMVKDQFGLSWEINFETKG